MQCIVVDHSFGCFELYSLDLESLAELSRISTSSRSQGLVFGLSHSECHGASAQ